MDDLDFAAKIVAKLFMICSPKMQERGKLFKRITPRVGDYMGSGYSFIDAFEKIYTEYEENVSEEFYRLVRKNLDEMNKE